MKIRLAVECRDREDMDQKIETCIRQFFRLAPSGWDPGRENISIGEISVRPNPNLERRSWSHMQWLAEFDVEAP